MRFASIYDPAIVFKDGSPSELLKKCWHVALIVLAFHAAILFLLSIRPIFNKPDIEEVKIIAIDLPQPVVEQPDDVVKPERSEKSRPVALSQNINRESAPIVKPSAAPQNVDTAPVVKFNEHPIKTVPIEKPEEKKIQAAVTEKVEEKKIQAVVTEKPEEKKIQVTPVEKVEEKKVLIQAPVQSPVKPEETMAAALPVIVDKKNKDKDAPEALPVGKGSSASSAASSSGGSSESTKSSSSDSASSGSAGSTAQSVSSQASSNTEIQAQVSSSKSISIGGGGGNASTADADYRAGELRNRQPPYPVYARKFRQEGVVILSVEVMTDGSAGDVRIASSSGNQLLDQSALETIKQWQFKPAKKDGVAYVQKIRIPITFSLNSR
jgi:protein TonB